LKEYLPIGSVVVLKEGNKKIMIYGRRQMAADSGEIYDYVACFYPEGNISPEYTFMFNHGEVGEIVFRGYADKDEEQFANMLNELENEKE